MPAPRAIAPDGSPVEGFRFDGATVTYEGAEPVAAGIRYELGLPETEDPRWLVPGVFYGENRLVSCTRIYPRFTPGRVDLAPLVSSRFPLDAVADAFAAATSPGALKVLIHA